MVLKRTGYAAAAFILAIVLVLGAVLYAGCGGGSGDYTNAVLSQWSELEDSTSELLGTAEDVEEEKDLEGFSDAFKDTEKVIASFQDELDAITVPSDLSDSNDALEDFLSAYDDYLSTTGDYLDEMTGGDQDTVMPDMASLAEEAQNALEEYQDSQDYNPAELDEGIWDLGEIVRGILVDLYGVEDLNDPKYAAALEVLDQYYIAFNAGDGEDMLSYIDFASPMLDNISEEFFLAQVGEAYAAGLQAEGTVTSAEAYTDETGNWVTVYMTVDYTETVDMEGNTVPARSEDLVVDLYEEDGEWYIFNITLADDPEQTVLW